MSDRDARACGLCGNTDQEGEYTGTNARGCPACGSDLSPVVGSTLHRETGKDVITHNGRPYGYSQRPAEDSVVLPHPTGRGFQALIRPDRRDPNTLLKAEGKTRTEAARNATAAAAAHLGRQFKVRDKDTEKRIQNYEY